MIINVVVYFLNGRDTGRHEKIVICIDDQGYFIITTLLSNDILAELNRFLDEKANNETQNYQIRLILLSTKKANAHLRSFTSAVTCFLTLFNPSGISCDFMFLGKVNARK
jgi:hypothetical protein